MYAYLHLWLNITQSRIVAFLIVSISCLASPDLLSLSTRPSHHPLLLYIIIIIVFHSSHKGHRWRNTMARRHTGMSGTPSKFWHVRLEWIENLGPHMAWLMGLEDCNQDWSLYPLSYTWRPWPYFTGIQNHLIGIKVSPLLPFQCTGMSPVNNPSSHISHTHFTHRIFWHQGFD